MHMRVIITDMRPENINNSVNVEQASNIESRNNNIRAEGYKLELESDGVEKTTLNPESASALAEKIVKNSLPSPLIDNSVVDDKTTFAVLNPLVAGDDDLIEKEWVDRAKKIVQDTLDDPHERDRSIGLLQIDYIKKRYGKDLGASQ